MNNEIINVKLDEDITNNMANLGYANDKKMKMAEKMANNPQGMTLGRAIKSGVKKAGNFLDKTFIEPSRNVNRIQQAKDKDMARRAAAGEYNQ